MDIFINWFLNTCVRIDPAAKVLIIVAALFFAFYCITRVIKDYGDSKKPGFYAGWFILLIASIGVMLLYTMY